MSGPPDDKDAKVPKVSGRYRKVEVRIWGDERFCALSPIPPCGRGLFLYLMTGPHTGPVPGLFRAGRAAMAEELDWSLEDFDKAFQEVFGQGLVIADFKARVMWVPNAIKHNKPESPNVVKSWAAEFDLIPECDLKRKAFAALKANIHALGEPYAKAFDESIGKAFPKVSPKAIPNQEQEQQQEQLINSVPKGTADKSAPAQLSAADLWSAAVELLKGQGMTEKTARTFIGGIRSQHGNDIADSVIQAAMVERPADARAWIAAACLARGKGSARTPKALAQHTGFATLNYTEGLNEDGTVR